MEYETGFEYAGNLPKGNSCLDNLFLAPSIISAPAYDFSHILKFSPPVRESQMNMLYLHVNPQLVRAGMPGNYVNGSEYFLPFQARTSPIPCMTASAIAPAALPMAMFSDFTANNIPQSVLVESQMEPQSDILAAQQDTDLQHGETHTTHIAGQNRAERAIYPPSAGEEPMPKKRRGARKKLRTEEELAIRRKKHLQRNKEAAQKCRQKKRVLDGETKEMMLKERQKNLVIWKQVASAQDGLDSLQIFALSIEYHCYFDDHKTSAKTALEAIMKMATKLQDLIDICNQRRAQIFQGLVMQRSFSGYVQQDSMREGLGSTHDSQSPAMSPQNSTVFSEKMLSPHSTRGSSYASADSTLISQMATEQPEKYRIVLPHIRTLLSTSRAPLLP